MILENWYGVYDLAGLRVMWQGIGSVFDHGASLFVRSGAGVGILAVGSVTILGLLVSRLRKG